MSELLPIILIIVAILAAVSTYRSIRRGGARFYTLEREAILRRATFTLTGTVLLFMAAIGLLLLERQQQTVEGAGESGELMEEAIATTATPFLQELPPLTTLTPTSSLPTATPTPTPCRAVVEGTFGNGLTLRDAPAGAELDVLAEASLLTLLEDEPVSANGIVWIRIRTLFGDEGWVAEDFVSFSAQCER